jgi:alkylation response protein AidB-like acyl-CoA dehydrogenase
VFVSIDEVGAFAAESVLGTLAERNDGGSFSRDLWRAMGRMGLLGLTLDAGYGGSGGTALQLSAAVREFAERGCDLGLTLSWITHLSLCEKSIEVFGTDSQKKKYLPLLASGEWVGAAAVSEPKTGAHPGGMQTTATRTSSGYRLDGRKIFITDGPVADLLVVIAVTGLLETGENELTAFLVETSSPGFTARRMDLNFLKTSPHAELEFDGVELPAESVLGGVGEGHSKNSKAAFARERSLVVSALPGLFAKAAREASGMLAGREGGFDLEGNEAYSWIHHLAALQGYRALSEGLVRAAFDDPGTWRDNLDTIIFLGISYARWGSWLAEFARTKGISGFPLDIMLSDMKLVTVGEGLLLKEGRKRFIG